MVLRFGSPRFQGDPVLEEILNDPDTGTRRLEAGSRGDAVRRVQQALYDLGWTLRLEPPVRDPAEFVVGEYGPKTRATVLAFRTHYKVHWPPGDPAGRPSPNAGPRTLRLLDVLCVRLDAATSAIAAKVAALRAQGVDVVPYPDQPPYHPVSGTYGVEQVVRVGDEDGAVLHHPTVGTWLVSGPIYVEYLTEHDYARGPLGFPVGDVHEQDGMPRCDFEHGTLVQVPDGTVTPVIRATTGSLRTDDPDEAYA